MTLALTVAILTAGAVYLFTRREMLRVILGFVLLGHAGNLILFAAGGTDRRTEAFHPSADPSAMADPLPQAFVLTAIVIAFSITVFMLVLAVTGDSSDDTAETVEELDVEAESRADGVRHTPRTNNTTTTPGQERP